MRHGLVLLSLVVPLMAQPQPKTGLTLAGLSLRGASVLADAESRAYYLYSTAESPDSGVMAYKSRDLAKWEGPFPVFIPPEGSWASPADGSRNPEVHQYRGRYYLLVTLAASGQVIAKPPDSWRVNTRQGTEIFVSDSPLGPFTTIPGGGNKSQTPENFAALDGTLCREGDLSYLVYVHDWTQVVDATVEAVRLKADLSAPIEDALHLFKASDAPWLQQQTKASRDPRYYVAGEPFLHRTRNGSLVMLWSSTFGGKSAITVARSVTGKVRGPWKQADTLLRDGSLPGTIFSAFDGRLMMAVHQPQARVRLVELVDAGDALRLKAAAE